MTERVFFTSDTHFFHPKLARLRGFGTVEYMNERIIERWNDVIQKSDRVYHLGDVSFGKYEPTMEVLKRLNGRIYLIRGNHDGRAVEKCAERFEWIKDSHYFKVSDQKISLSHYAFRVWRSSHHGSWHLYGHSHGMLPGVGKSLDVGIDCNCFQPIPFAWVKVRLDLREIAIVDGHGAGYDDE